MRIKFLILTIFFALFWVSPTFAVTITTSNIPSSISDQSFTIDVAVSGASTGTNYLRIDLYKDGTANYFGETYNNTEWYNGSTGTQYFPISITSGQTTNTTLSGRIGNPTSAEYPESGAYKLKIRRYTSSGNAASSDTQTPQDITISYNPATPTPTPTPSSSPTPSPTASASSTSSNSSSSFTISNAPSQIDSTEEFKVSVNLSLSSSPNTTFYLKGAFKKKDHSNYFGQTKVSGSWVRNNQTYSDQFKITTNSSGAWSGSLDIQPDILDSGYDGAGDYIFKVGKYTESGSLSWSNEAIIKINAQEVIFETSEEDKEVLGTSETKKKSQSNSEDHEISLEKYLKVATPASKSVAQASPNVEVKGTKKINFLSTIGTIIAIIGLSWLTYAIYNNFRKRNKEIG